MIRRQSLMHPHPTHLFPKHRIAATMAASLSSGLEKKDITLPWKHRYARLRWSSCSRNG